MPSLRDIQRDFSRALLGGAQDALVAAVVTDRLAPERRVQIYRNHVRITLREALAATFPAIELLVGAGYFATVARRFVEIQPPRSPVLAEYGASFPAFLETAPNAPVYLADVARLEWALNHAYHAADAAPLTADALVAMTPDSYSALRLAPMPSTAIVRSPYPILAIWRANQPGADAGASIDLDQGGQQVLVWRDRDGEAVCRALSEPEAAFIGALIGGHALTDAANAALAVDAGFDLPAAFAGLLAAPIMKTLGGNSP